MRLGLAKQEDGEIVLDRAGQRNAILARGAQLGRRGQQRPQRRGERGRVKQHAVRGGDGGAGETQVQSGVDCRGEKDDDEEDVVEEGAEQTESNMGAIENTQGSRDKVFHVFFRQNVSRTRTDICSYYLLQW